MKQSFIIFLLCLLLSTFVFAEDADPYLIVPGVSIGVITESTTELDLVDLFGIENVQRITRKNDMNETITETILFPYDSMRKLQIIWAGESASNGSTLIKITGSNTLWHTAEGISLGTSLIELEIMNSTYFHLTGFNFTNPGMITDCGYGKLKFLGYLTPNNDVVKGRAMILRLDQPNAVYERITKEEYQAISTDGIFRSDNSIMERLNPYVVQIDFMFSK